MFSFTQVIHVGRNNEQVPTCRNCASLLVVKIGEVRTRKWNLRRKLRRRKDLACYGLPAVNNPGLHVLRGDSSMVATHFTIDQSYLLASSQLAWAE